MSYGALISTMFLIVSVYIASKIQLKWFAGCRLEQTTGMPDRTGTTQECHTIGWIAREAGRVVLELAE